MRALGGVGKLRARRARNLAYLDLYTLEGERGEVG